MLNLLQWEQHCLSLHQQRLQEAEKRRLAHAWQSQNSLLSKWLRNLRQQLGARPQAQRNVQLPQPK